MAEKKPMFKRLTKIFSSNPMNSHSESVREQIDKSAALDSFKTHWSQAFEIMSSKVLNEVTVDDISSVVNHIDQMVTLLLQENDLKTNHFESNSSPILMSPLLDYLLIESVLEKLLNWSAMCGEWYEIMALEQLKLYELLVSQICHNSALFQRPLIRPLLGLLSRFVDKVCHLEVEKRLVVLLNTLFMSLSKNLDLLELFYLSEPQIASHMETKFLIFSLLIPFLHRDGPVGQQARDAILLCMALSRKNDSIGKYVAQETDFCPVLATGLSGLYSSLPRRLLTDSIVSDDWHQITNEDIHENPELEAFLNSLEFCNAVAQIAHPSVQIVLLNYVYNGFLVPVIGPALHQNTLEEIIATTAYFDLFIRAISEPNLLKIFLKFLCLEKYEGERILQTLITRIMANSKLSLITLVLFRSLMELNCEDLLLELILKYLKTGKHLIGGTEHQMLRINDCNCLSDSAQKLLSLIPNCCHSSHVNYMQRNAKTEGYVFVETNIDSVSQNSENSCENGEQNDTKEVQYLLFNYLDYLKDANIVISNCIRATRSWSCKYDANSHININNCSENSFVNNINTNICANNSNNSNTINDNHFVPQINGSNGTQEEEEYEDYCSPIGPFLETLFLRLEAFCENDVFTNLQLTGLISRLASYPQPLLRSFLFNQTLVFRNTKNLSTILVEISKKLNQMSSQINNFDEMLRKARHFLFVRENRILNPKLSISAKLENEIYSNGYNSRPVRSNSITSISSQTGIEVRRKSFKEGFKDLFRSTPRTMRRSHSSSLSQPNPPPILESVSGQGYRYFKPMESPEVAIDANDIEENERIRKIVLAAIVFEEFVRELSAISHEHYILEFLDPIPTLSVSKPK